MRTTTELAEKKTARDYLLQRDEARQAAIPPRPAFWSTTSIRMAAHQFESCSKKRSFAQQARITKVIFDKYFHGENRIKGCKDPSLKDELQACSLCGDYDSEEHGYCHCQGPRNDNLLQPIRTAMFADISATINSLPFGPGHALLSLYREFASTASQPQRVWKGCLSSSQQARISALLNLPMSGKEKTVLLSSLRQVQHLLATTVLRIRTQLTSYVLPHMRGSQLLPKPSSQQASDMAALRNQPRITEALWGPEARQSQGALASRNALKRRRIKPTPPARTQRQLCLYPRTSAITLQVPTSTPSSSPAPVASSPLSSPVRSRRQRRGRLSVSNSPVPPSTPLPSPGPRATALSVSRPI